MADETGNKKKSWGGFFLKLTFFVGAFVLIILTILANMGGNSDVLKGGIEDYLASSTGFPAEVKTLNNMGFFPTIRIDFEDVTFYETAAREKQVGSIESVRMAFGFFDLLFGTGKIRDINLQALQADPGVFAPKALSVNTLTIRDDASPPHLRAEGQYAGQGFTFDMEMDKRGEGEKAVFRFHEDRKAEISYGSLLLSAQLKDTLGRDFTLENLRLSYEDQPVLNGSLQFKRTGQSMAMAGKLTLAEHGTALDFDLDWQRQDGQPQLAGDIEATGFAIPDFLEGSAFRKAVKIFTDMMDQGKDEHSLFLGGLTGQVDAFIHSFSIEDKQVGQADLGITFDHGIHIQTKKASLSEGILNWDFQIKQEKEGADLVLKSVFDAKGIDYGALQQELYGASTLSGELNIKSELNAQAQDLGELENNLRGNVSLIGGEGQLKSRIIDLWGSGLISAMLPDFSTEEKLNMNCVIADFDVDSGIARAEPFFIDTKELTIRGEGEYNIVTNQFDMTLEPQSKEIAIGNIATAVNMRGSLTNPQFEPSMLSLGLKLGKMLFSTINPALMAYTLTDFGLAESHPCASFLDASSQSGKTAQE